MNERVSRRSAHQRHGAAHPSIGRAGLALAVVAVLLLIGCKGEEQQLMGAANERRAGTPAAAGARTTMPPGRGGAPPEIHSTPQPAAGEPIVPQFAVILHPVGCHSEPRATAPIASRRAPGEIVAMESLSFQADGLWYREAAQPCWIRAVPGPMLYLFETRRHAECFALPNRRPQPLVADCVRISFVDDGFQSGAGEAAAFAPPGAVCTGNRLLSSPAGLQVAELPQTRTDERGLVTWRWREPPPSRQTQSTVTVTCVPGGTASITLPPR